MRFSRISGASIRIQACVAAAAATGVWSCKGEAGAPPAALQIEAVASVSVVPGMADVSVGRTAQLAATVMDSVGTVLEGRRVTWESGNDSIATVDENGVVTGVAVGSAQITAETGGVLGAGLVNVVGEPVASVTVVPDRADLRVGQSVLLTATMRDSAGTVLTGRIATWASSDTVVAVVDGSGLVTTRQVGNTTVTATSEDQTGTATVVATTTSGPCSSNLSNVTLPLCDGTYTQDITPSTFPSNSVIQAQNPGGVRFTGGFDAGDGLTFRGIVLKSDRQKTLGSRTVYEEMSFVGGPACGNSVNSLAGSYTTIRRSAFFGRGGRYLLLPWHVSNVRLEDVIFRTDGGWGEGGSGCSEYEPNAALNDYDSPGFTCINCVLFDGIVTAGPESETLGGLGVGCHLNTSGALFDNNLIVNSAGGFWADGLGTCDTVVVRNSAAFGSTEWGIKRNVLGTTTVIRFTTRENCGAFKGAIQLVESVVGGINSGCGGSTSGGPGAAVQLNAQFLDDLRWRREMCDEAGVTRGWCGGTQTLSAYLRSFF